MLPARYIAETLPVTGALRPIDWPPTPVARLGGSNHPRQLFSGYQNWLLALNVFLESVLKGFLHRANVVVTSSAKGDSVVGVEAKKRVCGPLFNVVCRQGFFNSAHYAGESVPLEHRKSPRNVFNPTHHGHSLCSGVAAIPVRVQRSTKFRSWFSLKAFAKGRNFGSFFRREHPANSKHFLNRLTVPVLPLASATKAAKIVCSVLHLSAAILAKTARWAFFSGARLGRERTPTGEALFSVGPHHPFLEAGLTRVGFPEGDSALESTKPVMPAPGWRVANLAFLATLLAFFSRSRPSLELLRALVADFYKGSHLKCA